MKRLLESIKAVADEVRQNAALLNELDGFAGDGDLGVTMSIAANALDELVPTLRGSSTGEILSACGRALVSKAPSTSGTLIGSALLRAGREAEEPFREDDATRFGRLLGVARDEVVARGKADVGSKTMLDALEPATIAAAAAVSGGQDLCDVLDAASVAAASGALASATLVPRHGRAGWLAERSQGHEDSGARLVAIVLDAARVAACAGSHDR